MNVELASATITERDIEGVVATLRSGRLATGARTDAFEEAIASYVGVAHAIAVSSGTAGLHVILASLGIGPGDEVIVPSFTFAASVNAILLVGARPVFCDIEGETFNMNPVDVESRITSQTRAVMVVDVFGHPADWTALTDVAQRHGLFLIDDSCEALGSEHAGKRLGSFGNAACFAFYPNKQITTGEGGMVVTNDDDLARVAHSLRNQGRDTMGAWLEHVRLGYNYRMDEMSASLGLTQMEQIDRFIELRQAVADGYTRRLEGTPWIRPPRFDPTARISWFVYVVLLDREVDRDAVMTALADVGVPTRNYFSALHLQHYLQAYRPPDGSLPVTEDVSSRTMAIPFHPNLSEPEIDYVVDQLSIAAAKSVRTVA